MLTLILTNCLYFLSRTQVCSTGGTGICNFEYRYSINAGISYTSWSTSIPNFSATGTNNRIQTRRVCSGADCNISGTNTKIWLVDNVTISSAGPDQNTCKKSDVVLSGNNPTSGGGLWSWTGPGTVSYEIGSATTSNATVSFSDDGTHVGTWTLDNGACPSDNDVVEIKSNAPGVITTVASSIGTCNSNQVNNWLHLYDANNKIIASVNVIMLIWEGTLVFHLPTHGVVI